VMRGRSAPPVRRVRGVSDAGTQQRPVVEMGWLSDQQPHRSPAALARMDTPGPCMGEGCAHPALRPRCEYNELHRHRDALSVRRRRQQDARELILLSRSRGMMEKQMMVGMIPSLRARNHCRQSVVFMQLPCGRMFNVAEHDMGGIAAPAHLHRVLSIRTRDRRSQQRHARQLPKQIQHEQQDAAKLPWGWPE
jgi:hypothetical protein